jgi:hypothetical protein
VACPLCGDETITRKLSAPRLNLGVAAPTTQAPAPALADGPPESDIALQTAWLAMARRVMANTDDVGPRFAEEARRMHYGETEERGIRGQASPAETESLMEEGIAVLPFNLPESLKGPLQ